MGTGSRSRWFLFGCVALALHVLFLASIFDIHFQSPVVHGMTPHHCPEKAPARRLVLVVSDGLRADKFFGFPPTNAPFLRSVCESVGSCGLSLTHVPTESRPGHVALIAGLYEDVSAITKGWKENPVEFDSLFNESRYTFSWGSPDILPMFAKGSSSGHVFTETYDANVENFASANASTLDTWVVTKFEEFLQRAETDANLRSMINADQIVFFFHLLAMDIIGHGNKPTSPEYLDGLRVSDHCVKRLVKLVDNFYADNETAFVFTSDHGMTDWGSHGAGSDAETLTPIVTWGAGVRSDGNKPNISQVDITPLMAALIGVNFPMNSMGILPVDYLQVPEHTKAAMLYTNAMQILAQCKLQSDNAKKMAVTLYFKQYQFSDQLDDSHIKKLIENKDYSTAIEETRKLISTALDALYYYHTYDLFVLSCSIILAFVGWMFVVITVIVEQTSEIWPTTTSLEQKVLRRNQRLSLSHSIVYVSVVTFLVGLLYVKQVVYQYYLYFLSPVFLWAVVDYRFAIMKSLATYLRDRVSHLKLCILISSSIFGIEILVISFFERMLLSLGLATIATWSWSTSLRHRHRWLCFSWTSLCLILAIFPLLPVVGKDANYSLVCLCGWLALILIGYTVRRPELGFVRSNRWQKEPIVTVYVMIVQMLLLVLSIYVVQTTSTSLSEKSGLPLINQILSWSITISSFVIPFYGSLFLLTRLLHIATSMMTVYTLLSTSYENLFFLCLSLLMVVWMLIEFKLSTTTTKRLQDHNFGVDQVDIRYWTIKFDDVRRAYFSIYFLYLAFFGTGNMASINSFDPASVLTFLTVFNPFVMGSLLMLKVMIPFLIVSCTIYSIGKVVRFPQWSLFLLILLVSDVMGLHFFLWVRNTGSWLDIGMSISHYVIAILTSIIFMLLYALSHLLTSKRINFSYIKSHFN